MSTLMEKYTQEIAPELLSELGLRNVMMAPRLRKIVVNMGFGIVDKDTQKALLDDLSALTGQKPCLRKATKSISNFKLREGMPVGAKVTLRGRRMFEFLERLITAALPRIRDFRGLKPGGFDGAGNYTFGVREQSIFPEIDPNNVSSEQGMDITLVTRAGSRDAARLLLTKLGMPFAGGKE